MSVEFHDRNEIPPVELPSSGGLPFTNESAVPFAMTGLIVRSGTRIDAVQPIYRELKSDGTTGEERIGPRFGGMGGAEIRVEKPGYVITGLGFRLATGWKPSIRTVLLYVEWTRWTPKGLDASDRTRSNDLGTPNGGSGQDGTPFEIQAPTGHVAIGIHGRCGSEVDRISLITARPVVAG